MTIVSRALGLLGFDQIKSLALSVLRVDRLVEGSRARHVLRDFGQALADSRAACDPLTGRTPPRAEGQ